MEQNENKRRRRSKEERASEIDAKLEKLRSSLNEIAAEREAAKSALDAKEKALKDKIKALEGKKKDILNPSSAPKQRMTKKRRIEALVNKAHKAGFSLDEIEQLLSLDEPEAPAETEPLPEQEASQEYTRFTVK